MLVNRRIYVGRTKLFLQCDDRGTSLHFARPESRRFASNARWFSMCKQASIIKTPCAWHASVTTESAACVCVRVCSKMAPANDIGSYLYIFLASLYFIFLNAIFRFHDFSRFPMSVRTLAVTLCEKKAVPV